MIRVLPAERFEGNRTTRFQASIERDRGHSNLPDVLWYEVPVEIGRVIRPGVAPFVLPLLHLVMELNESLEVTAPLCERLAKGLESYQAIFHEWLPKRFSRMHLNFPSLNRAPSGVRQGGVASAFSGGVDSFYTLWKSLNSDSTQPISHALLVHGFDIPLAKQSSFDTAARAYRSLCQRLELELVTVRTNVREFPLDWEFAHGAALAAAGHLLVPLISTFVIPSSRSSTTLAPWGSDPRTDPLLSSDLLETVHDDTNSNRLEKLRQMIDWWPLRDHLRVCWKHPDGLRNCCRCNKCNFTMIELDELGILNEISTFPLPPRKKDYRRIHFATDHQREVARALVAEAHLNGRTDIEQATRHALIRSHLVDLVYQIVLRPLKRFLRRIRLAHI